MPDKLDPTIADRLASSAIGCLQPTRGEKVVSPRGVLKEAILWVVQEAYEIGRLAGEKERLSETPDRVARTGLPGWTYGSITQKAWPLTRSGSNQ
jgi:hypothetical protein